MTLFRYYIHIINKNINYRYPLTNRILNSDVIKKINEKIIIILVMKKKTLPYILQS